MFGGKYQKWYNAHEGKEGDALTSYPAQTIGLCNINSETNHQY